MRIANIAPAQAVRQVIDPYETYHLVLADLILQYGSYREFYIERLERGDFVTMDVMSFERPKGTRLDAVVAAAHTLGPTEIVLPDVRFDWWKTIKQAEEASKVLVDEGFCNFMAVPQGKDWGQYSKCAVNLMRIPGVKTLGIIEETEEWSSLGRIQIVRSVIREIEANVGVSPRIHLLGMCENMKDLMHGETRALVRGVDSAKLIVWGMDDISVSTDLAPDSYPGRPSGYLHKQSVPNEEAVLGNIRRWRNYVEADVSGTVEGVSG